VTFLLQMAAVVLGPAGIPLSLLAPVPAALVGMLYGAAASGVVVAVTTAAVLAVAGPAGGASYLLQYGLGSWMLPLLFRRGWPWGRAVATTLAVVLAVAALGVAGYSALRAESPVREVRQYLQAELDRALEMSRSADLPEADKAELEALSKSTVELLARVYPGVLVAVGGAILLLTVLLLSVLAKGRYEIPGVPFMLWKAPELLVWPLIAGGFGALLGSGFLQTAALNLLIVLLPVYFLQGLAVVSFFFQRQGFSPLIRAISYLLLLVFNPFQFIVAGIGIFDLWIDFRKPRVKNT
jgi:uncharacterized protein YybS (DUF2232 family)